MRNFPQRILGTSLVSIPVEVQATRLSQSRPSRKPLEMTRGGTFGTHLKPTTGCGSLRASQILCDRPKIPERGLRFHTGGLQAVADVIVDQGLLGILDRALDGAKLLGDLGAGPPCLRS